LLLIITYSAVDTSGPSSRSGHAQDDIRTEYHPSSNRPPQIDSFENFGKVNLAPPPIRNRTPWLPFHSQAEFTFAEITLQTAMSNKQLDSLISVVHILMEGKEPFKIKNHRDVQNLWDKASESLTPVGI
jgi:hypothetical protein